MTMVLPLGWQVVDANGDPISGAKAYTYLTGTTTPRATYSDSALTPGLELSNPIVADAAGRFPAAYGPTTADYKVVLTDASDAVIATYDPVQMTGTPGAGSIGTSQLDANAATNAKLADMATQRVKGRTTAGTGDPEDLTITQVLNMLVGGTVAGTIPVRGVSDWSVLGQGTAGQVLISGGVGLFPSFETGGLRLLSTLTASSSASLELPLFSSAYTMYMVEFRGIRPATDAANPQWAVSTDGTNYLSTGTYWYQWLIASAGAAAAGGVSGTATAIDMYSDVSNAAGEGISGVAFISNASGAGGTVIVGAFGTITSGGAPIVGLFTGRNTTSSLVTRMRLAFDTGNIADGSLKVYGIGG